MGHDYEKLISKIVMKKGEKQSWYSNLNNKLYRYKLVMGQTRIYAIHNKTGKTQVPKVRGGSDGMVHVTGLGIAPPGKGAGENACDSVKSEEFKILTALHPDRDVTSWGGGDLSFTAAA